VRVCCWFRLLLFLLPFYFQPASSQPAAPELRVKSESTCRNWAVTTTIFPPTTTIKQIASLSDWCLVIAGDKKAPKDYQVSGRAIYLSPADQERMPFATGKLLRWNHFGRKNLGFLYALQHGARWVYDTDDDNELQSLSAGIPLPRPNALIDEVETQFKLYNLYPQMSTAPSSWPRGFPLESIKDRRTWNSSFTRRRWPARRVGVVQSLADHDPDVDGIYRLTQPLPFVFPPSTRRGGVAGRAGASGLAAQAAAKAATAPERAEEEQEGRRLAEARRAALKGAHLAGPTAKAMLKGGGKGSGKGGGKASSKGGGKALGGKALGGVGGGRGKASTGSYQLVSLPRGTMMPYNAQATLHAYDALWGLLLPCTVHGRVTDIWRAYFTQRLLWDAGYRIAFSTPWVTQYRNAHNYLADFNSEIPLYQQAGALVQALLDWKPKAATMPGRIEELYILMYEMNVLGLDDVKLAQAGLGDLMRVGYRFPPIRGGEESP
jgi:hypothetical protein